MAVRQYIGARYVTKIYESTGTPNTAEWDANVNYEPLTLVTYNFGSYLSKKEVPATVGDPASNPEYWVQTGYYNGQISQLQQDILDLQSEIQDVYDTNFIKVSSFDTGSDSDTVIMQRAVDNAQFLYMDRDFNIGPITITKPVTLNLGGNRITGNTNDASLITIDADYVEIYNGEIYTTEATPDNLANNGGVFRINDGGDFVHGNMAFHNLYLSSNAAITMGILAEAYNIDISNVIFDGDRSNKPTGGVYEGLNIEWRGDNPITRSYHPHDITVQNCTFIGYNVSNGGHGVRISACFNVILQNIYAYNCYSGALVYVGDYGSTYALAKYNDLVNKNVILDNWSLQNCIGAMFIMGKTGVEDMTVTCRNIDAATDSSSAAQAVSTNYCTESLFENIKIKGAFMAGILLRATKSVIKNCRIDGVDNYGIAVTGSNNIVDGCFIENVNQAGGSSESLNTSGLQISTGDSNKLVNSTIANGSSEGAIKAIRIAADASNTLCVGNIFGPAGVRDNAPGSSLLANNITLT